MEHYSINPNILWYVDTIDYNVNSRHEIRMWVASKTHAITHLTIDNFEIDYTTEERPDVKLVYPDMFVTGFKIKVNDELINETVQVHHKDGHYEIEPLRKFFVFYSGFQYGHKNLIVVDNFYYEPDMIREYAINNLNFNNSNYHKGKRSDRFILNGTKEKLEEILGRRILNWNVPEYANGVFQYCVASDPVVYHVDTQQFAGVVFLTPDAPLTSGTATFKSKITGKFRLEGNDEEYEKTFKGLSNEMNFYDSSTLELVDRVGNVYNRLVLWDAKAIHAATQYFGDDINNSRFFQLFFFDVE